MDKYRSFVNMDIKFLNIGDCLKIWGYAPKFVKTSNDFVIIEENELRGNRLKLSEDEILNCQTSLIELEYFETQTLHEDFTHLKKVAALPEDYVFKIHGDKFKVVKKWDSFTVEVSPDGSSTNFKLPGFVKVEVLNSYNSLDQSYRSCIH